MRRRLANNEHTARQDFSIIIIAKLTPRRLASKNCQLSMVLVWIRNITMKEEYERVNIII